MKANNQKVIVSIVVVFIIAFIPLGTAAPAGYQALQ